MGYELLRLINNTALHQPFAKRSANMKLMKQVLAQSTIQRAIIKLAKDWS
jgi:hypothetical protein